MSDALEPRPTTPFPEEGSAPASEAVAADPLAEDWSEGLSGPVRALDVPQPRLLSLEGLQAPAPLPGPEAGPAVAPMAEEVEAPDAWDAPSEDPLQSTPPPPSGMPSVIVALEEQAPGSGLQAPGFAPPAAEGAAAVPLPDATPPAPAPAFLPDVTPPSPAPASPAEAAPAAADEAAPAAPDEVVELRAEDAAPEPPPPQHAADAWSAPPPPQPASTDDAWAAPPSESAPTPWSEPVPAARSSDTSAEAAPAQDAPAEPVPTWDQVTAISVPAAAEAPPAEAGWEMPSPVPAPPAVAAEPVADSAEPIAEVVSVSPAAEAVAPAADDPWSAAPPAAEPVQEWAPETPSGEWEEARKPAAALPAEAPAADWGTLSSGPDWSAPAPAEAAAPAEEAWASAPPPVAESAWDATPPLAEEVSWDGPPPPAPGDAPRSAPEAATGDWSAPEAPPPPRAAAWNAPAVGASALEQLESEPEIAPVPGAAQELFGSVPVGASLSVEGDEPHELGLPEELASPEDVLRPVAPVDDDDPDLLVPVDEEEPPPAPVPQPQPLAILQSPAAGALQVPGEHRVAVHTRGGRTRRGSVKDVDLSKSQFPLIPQGGGAPEPVYHAEVKAIFFMLAPGEKPRTGDGARVKVTFADGRAIEGQRDGVDAKHGFFLVPSDAARTNTRRIYVARDATTDIKEG